MERTQQNLGLRLLSFLLAALMILSIAPLTALQSSAAFYTGQLKYNASGKFKIMVLADIQDDESVASGTMTLILKTIQRESPNLVVFTGDNTKNNCNDLGSGHDNVKASINTFLTHIKSAGIPFVVTFGNHDSEGNLDASRTELYEYFEQKGGGYMINHDVAALDGVGNGYVPIYNNAGTTELFRVFVMDSNDYDGDNYDNVHTNQIDYYLANSNINHMVFQHIIVPDIYTTGILTSAGVTNTTTYSGPVNLSGNITTRTFNAVQGRTDYSGAYYILDSARTSQYGMQEQPCPPNLSTYTNSSHKSTSGLTWYGAWRSKASYMKGAFFGHDHMNYFMGTDSNGITMGYCKAATYNSYNDGDAGCRIFELSTNGTYTSWTDTSTSVNAGTQISSTENDIPGTLNAPPVVYVGASGNSRAKQQFASSGSSYIQTALLNQASKTMDPADLEIEFTLAGASNFTLTAPTGVTYTTTVNTAGQYKANITGGSATAGVSLEWEISYSIGGQTKVSKGFSAVSPISSAPGYYIFTRQYRNGESKNYCSNCYVITLAGVHDGQYVLFGSSRARNANVTPQTEYSGSGDFSGDAYGAWGNRNGYYNYDSSGDGGFVNMGDLRYGLNYFSPNRSNQTCHWKRNTIAGQSPVADIYIDEGRLRNISDLGLKINYYIHQNQDSTADPVKARPVGFFGGDTGYTHAECTVNYGYDETFIPGPGNYGSTSLNGISTSLTSGYQTIGAYGGNYGSIDIVGDRLPDDGQQFTMVCAAYAEYYRGNNGSGIYPHQNYTYTPFLLRFHVFDKSELRALVNTCRLSDYDNTKTDHPSYSLYEIAMRNAAAALYSPQSDTTTVASACSALQNAVTQLTQEGLIDVSDGNSAYKPTNITVPEKIYVAGNNTVASQTFGTTIQTQVVNQHTTGMVSYPTNYSFTLPSGVTGTPTIAASIINDNAIVSGQSVNITQSYNSSSRVLSGNVTGGTAASGNSVMYVVTYTIGGKVYTYVDGSYVCNIPMPTGWLVDVRDTNNDEAVNSYVQVVAPAAGYDVNGTHFTIDHVNYWTGSIPFSSDSPGAGDNPPGTFNYADYSDSGHVTYAVSASERAGIRFWSPQRGGGDQWWGGRNSADGRDDNYHADALIYADWSRMFNFTNYDISMTVRRTYYSEKMRDGMYNDMYSTTAGENQSINSTAKCSYIKLASTGQSVTTTLGNGFTVAFQDNGSGTNPANGGIYTFGYGMKTAGNNGKSGTNKKEWECMTRTGIDFRFLLTNGASTRNDAAAAQTAMRVKSDGYTQAWINSYNIAVARCAAVGKDPRRTSSEQDTVRNNLSNIILNAQYEPADYTHLYDALDSAVCTDGTGAVNRSTGKFNATQLYVKAGITNIMTGETAGNYRYYKAGNGSSDPYEVNTASGIYNGVFHPSYYMGEANQLIASVEARYDVCYASGSASTTLVKYDIRYQNIINNFADTILSEWADLPLRDADYAGVDAYTQLYQAGTAFSDENSQTRFDYIFSNGEETQTLNAFYPEAYFLQNNYDLWEYVLSTVVAEYKLPDQPIVDQKATELASRYNALALRYAGEYYEGSYTAGGVTYTYGSSSARSLAAEIAQWQTIYNTNNSATNATQPTGFGSGSVATTTYTPATWSPFKLAYEAAVAEYAKDYVTAGNLRAKMPDVSSVVTKIATLRSAGTNLANQPATLSYLTEQIDLLPIFGTGGAAGVSGGGSAWYDSTKWSTYTSALSTANTLKNTSGINTSRQAEINTAAQNLYNARMALDASNGSGLLAIGSSINSNASTAITLADTRAAETVAVYDAMPAASNTSNKAKYTTTSLTNLGNKKNALSTEYDKSSYTVTYTIRQSPSLTLTIDIRNKKPMDNVLTPLTNAVNTAAVPGGTGGLVYLPAYVDCLNNQRVTKADYETGGSTGKTDVNSANAGAYYYTTETWTPYVTAISNANAAATGYTTANQDTVNARALAVYTTRNALALKNDGNYSDHYASVLTAAQAKLAEMCAVITNPEGGSTSASPYTPATYASLNAAYNELNSFAALTTYSEPGSSLNIRNNRAIWPYFDTKIAAVNAAINGLIYLPADRTYLGQQVSALPVYATNGAAGKSGGGTVWYNSTKWNNYTAALSVASGLNVSSTSKADQASVNSAAQALYTARMALDAADGSGLLAITSSVTSGASSAITLADDRAAERVQVYDAMPAASNTSNKAKYTTSSLNNLATKQSELATEYNKSTYNVTFTVDSRTITINIRNKKPMDDVLTPLTSAVNTAAVPGGSGGLVYLGGYYDCLNNQKAIKAAYEAGGSLDHTEGGAYYYTSETWTAYSSALTAATNAVNASYTTANQSTINNSAQNLYNTRNALTLQSGYDYSATYQPVLDAAKAKLDAVCTVLTDPATGATVDNAVYSSSTKAALQTAYTNLKNLADASTYSESGTSLNIRNNIAIKPYFDSLISAVNTATTNLVVLPAYRTYVTAQVGALPVYAAGGAAEMSGGGAAWYNSTKWSTYTTKLSNANTINVASTLATNQAAVNTACQELYDARMALDAADGSGLLAINSAVTTAASTALQLATTRAGEKVEVYDAMPTSGNTSQKAKYTTASLNNLATARSSLNTEYVKTTYNVSFTVNSKTVTINVRNKKPMEGVLTPLTDAVNTAAEPGGTNGLVYLGGYYDCMTAQRAIRAPYEVGGSVGRTEGGAYFYTSETWNAYTTATTNATNAVNADYTTENQATINARVLALYNARNALALATGYDYSSTYQPALNAASAKLAEMCAVLTNPSTTPGTTASNELYTETTKAALQAAYASLLELANATTFTETGSTLNIRNNIAIKKYFDQRIAAVNTATTGLVFRDGYISYLQGSDYGIGKLAVYETGGAAGMTNINSANAGAYYYTTSTWSAYAEDYADAQQIIAGYQSTYKADSQAAINNALTQLYTTRNALALKPLTIPSDLSTNLANALTAYNKTFTVLTNPSNGATTSPNYYTTDTRTTLNNARTSVISERDSTLTDAYGVRIGGTIVRQTVFDSRVSALSTAYGNLVKSDEVWSYIEGADYGVGAKAAYEVGGSASRSQGGAFYYTSETWTAYQTAYSAATALIAAKSSKTVDDQADINTKLQNLYNARTALTLKTLDESGAASALQQAGASDYDSTVEVLIRPDIAVGSAGRTKTIYNYTSASRTRIANAISAVNTIVNDAAKTTSVYQPELNTAVAELSAALSAKARNAVDKQGWTWIGASLNTTFVDTETHQTVTVTTDNLYNYYATFLSDPPTGADSSIARISNLSTYATVAGSCTTTENQATLNQQVANLYTALTTRTAYCPAFNTAKTLAEAERDRTVVATSPRGGSTTVDYYSAASQTACTNALNALATGVVYETTPATAATLVTNVYKTAGVGGQTATLLVVDNAPYTYVNAEISSANAKLNQLVNVLNPVTNGTGRQYSYYGTAANNPTRAQLENVIASVVTGKKNNEIATVNGYATAVYNASLAMTAGPADLYYLTDAANGQTLIKARFETGGEAGKTDWTDTSVTPNVVRNAGEYYYTANSWSAYRTALSNANAVVEANTSAANQDTVNSYARALYSARQALILNPLSNSPLASEAATLLRDATRAAGETVQVSRYSVNLETELPETEVSTIKKYLQSYVTPVQQALTSYEDEWLTNIDTLTIDKEAELSADTVTVRALYENMLSHPSPISTDGYEDLLTYFVPTRLNQPAGATTSQASINQLNATQQAKINNDTTSIENFIGAGTKVASAEYASGVTNQARLNVLTDALYSYLSTTQATEAKFIVDMRNQLSSVLNTTISYTFRNVNFTGVRVFDDDYAAGILSSVTSENFERWPYIYEIANYGICEDYNNPEIMETSNSTIIQYFRDFMGDYSPFYTDLSASGAFAAVEKDHIDWLLGKTAGGIYLSSSVSADGGDYIKGYLPTAQSYGGRVPWSMPWHSGINDTTYGGAGSNWYPVNGFVNENYEYPYGDLNFNYTGWFTDASLENLMGIISRIPGTTWESSSYDKFYNGLTFESGDLDGGYSAEAFNSLLTECTSTQAQFDAFANTAADYYEELELIPAYPQYEKIYNAMLDFSGQMIDYDSSPYGDGFQYDENDMFVIDPATGGREICVTDRVDGEGSLVAKVFDLSDYGAILDYYMNDVGSVWLEDIDYDGVDEYMSSTLPAYYNQAAFQNVLNYYNGETFNRSRTVAQASVVETQYQDLINRIVAVPFKNIDSTAFQLAITEYRTRIAEEGDILDPDSIAVVEDLITSWVDSNYTLVSAVKNRSIIYTDDFNNNYVIPFEEAVDGLYYKAADWVNYDAGLTSADRIIENEDCFDTEDSTWINFIALKTELENYRIDSTVDIRAQYEVTRKSTSLQTAINALVVFVDQTAPTVTLIDVDQTAKQIVNSNLSLGLTEEDVAVNSYVYPGKQGKTLYIYTNKPQPTIIMRVDDVAQEFANGNAKISEPGAVALKSKTASAAGITTGIKYVGGDAVSNSNDNKAYVLLQPNFVNGVNGTAEYTLSVRDNSVNFKTEEDSYNYTNAFRYESDGAEAETIAGSNTDTDENGNPVFTVLINYHNNMPANGFDEGIVDGVRTGGPYVWQQGLENGGAEWQKSGYFYRSTNGATNYEIIGQNDTVYNQNDPTFGTKGLGSFIYRLDPSNSFDAAVINEYNKAAYTTPAQKATAAKNLFISKINNNVDYGIFNTYKNSDAKKFVAYGGGVNWSLQHQYVTGTLVFVHVIDRWGNFCNRIIKIDKIDRVGPANSVSGNTFTTFENGGSGFTSIDLFEYAMGASGNRVYKKGNYAVNTDNSPITVSIDGLTWSSPNNTITINTDTPNTRYTMGAKDVAGWQTTKDIWTDAQGKIVITATDSYQVGLAANSMGANEFTLNDGEPAQGTTSEPPISFTFNEDNTIKLNQAVTTSVLYAGAGGPIKVNKIEKIKFIVESNVEDIKLINADTLEEVILGSYRVTTDNGDGTKTVICGSNSFPGSATYYAVAKVDGEWEEFGYLFDIVTTDKTIRITFSAAGMGAVEYGYNGIRRNVTSSTMQFDVPYGAEVFLNPIASKTSSGGKTSEFRFWMNDATNRIVDDSFATTFTAVTNLKLTAVFTASAAVLSGKHSITYVGKAGNVIASYEVTSADSIDVPTAPVLTDYDFIGWSMTAADALASETDVIITPIYRPVGYFTITLTPGNYTVTGAGDYASRDTALIAASPSNKNGESFLYWIAADTGEIVTYNRVQSIIVVDDEEYTPVYGDATNLTPTPATRIAAVKYDAATSKVTFFADRSIPTDVKQICQAGIIVTREESIGTDADAFVIDGSTEIKKGNVSVPTNNGIYTVSMSNVSAGDTVYARAFIIYIDSADVIHYLYSNIATN